MRFPFILILSAVVALAVMTSPPLSTSSEPTPGLHWLRGLWRNRNRPSDYLRWEVLSPTETMAVRSVGRQSTLWLVEAYPQGCRLRVQQLQPGAKSPQLYEAVEQGPLWIRFACRERCFPRSLEIHYSAGRPCSLLWIEMAGPGLTGPSTETLYYEPSI